MRQFVSLEASAPIVRFWHWLETLSLFDIFVIGVLSPVLGLASVIGPALLSMPGSRHPQGLLWFGIENISFGRTILCLFCSGAVVALLSRRLGVLAASTAMVGYFLGTFLDLVSGTSGHQLLPFELAIYGFLTAFAVAGAGMVALVRR